MKICLLGEYSGDLDEGMRKVSSHFAEELRKKHQVLTLDMRNVFTKNFWNAIKNFSPEIIHYIHGPSIMSLILLKVISFYRRDAKTVMSAMHPHFNLLSKRFISLFKPDLILTQSYETETMFKKRGCKMEFLPCGVNVNKFTPITARIKNGLRGNYGINKEKFVILHIGSVKDGRNVQLLEKLQRKNNQVLIVGSTSSGIDQKLQKRLEESGCLVWTKFFKKIEEVFAMADCYIFPVMNRAYCIEMPLTVLEAMACNLPVISTKFGALPRVFEEGDGLFFAEKEKEFYSVLEGINNGIKIKTRAKVLLYSWENIGKKMEEIYCKIIGDVPNET